MVSDRTKNITPSLTLQISALAKKMMSEGKPMVNFGVGEPDFNTPEFIIEAAKKALDEGMTKYTPASGTDELKRAVCEKFKRDGLDYSPENIVISCGGKSSLFHAVASVINEGDEVLLPVPYWLTYPEQIKLSGGKVVEVRGEGNKVTAKDIEAHITEKTKLLILNSPNNPTGAVYSEREIKEIAKVSLKYGLYVISDEIYEKLVYGVKHYSIAKYSPEMKEKTILVNGMSKTYSMTGWRIGYLACNKEIAKAIGNLQSHTTSNPTTFAQYASAVALHQGDGKAEEMRAVFEKRRNLICSLADGIERVRYEKPEGAFYLFLDVSAFYGKTLDGAEINNSVEFCKAALSFGIALVPGAAFGDDRFIRISYAVGEEDIAVGMGRLKEYLKKLQ